MHIRETNIKTPDLAYSICTILRYDDLGNLRMMLTLYYFPGNLSYLCDSRDRVFSNWKILFRNFEKRKMYTYAYIHTP